jgi:hypothetical protein
MIAARRAKVEDRNREKLPDSPDCDPREVLDYLRQCSGRDIPMWVLQADVCDALTLLNWLSWEDRRRLLHFLQVGRARGLFLSQLGARLGIGKQGVIDLVDLSACEGTAVSYPNIPFKIFRSKTSCPRFTAKILGPSPDFSRTVVSVGV